MNTTISLNLSRFFNDQRSFVNLYIDEKYDTINDLRKHIKQTFGIKKRFCLLVADNVPHHFLPRAESIRILQGRKNVIVEPVTFKEPTHIKEKIDKYAEQLENFDDESILAREDLENECAKMYVENDHTESDNKKRSSQKKSSYGDIKEGLSCKIAVDKDAKNTSTKLNAQTNNLLLTENEDCNMLEYAVDGNKDSKTEEQNFQILTPHKELNKLETSTNFSHMSAKPNIIIQSVEKVHYLLNKTNELVNSTEKDSRFNLNSSRITTRARKRVRRNKSKLITFDADKINDADNLAQSFSSNLVAAKSTPNHIRFTEDLTISHNDSALTNEASLDISMNDAYSSDIVTKAKVINNCQTIENCELNQTNDDVASKNAWELLYEQFQHDPDKYASLKQLPVVGDIIACKVLRMTSTYEPELSSYIFALVVQVNAAECFQNSDLKLEILEGKAFLQQPLSGKFELPDSGQEDSDSNMINLKWHNIYDPKLILK
ncbi:uncharacterized protein LOC113377980 isoform X2 [Ctenocephalides felis]|uniref:uncharacterized protein LOC113365339 isoform X2 n=1 Tax=Ctenocephalides felis TaxID=7515 RepID=UPI000E6E15AC|nr:uncharacterized protein LOC113365339 isoform X2 [Ctenocephalides felis]XP_026474246.1 uncharacterized protein LOC113377980 isoform X2 [Ctenocephalides felis]